MPRASASPPSPTFLQGTRPPPLECSSWSRLGPGERQGRGSDPSWLQPRAVEHPSLPARTPPGHTLNTRVCPEHMGCGCAGAMVQGIHVSPTPKERQEPSALDWPPEPVFPQELGAGSLCSLGPTSVSCVWLFLNHARPFLSKIREFMDSQL